MTSPDGLSFARAALRLGFLTEAQAMEALSASLSDESTSVERWLMSRGTISASQAAAVFKELGGAPAPAKQRYRFGAEIARGGLGRVVEGRDEELDRDIAVKLVVDDLAPDLKARFLREAKLTARLDHPNIVPVYDIGRRGSEVFLCMKRVRGRELGAILGDLAKNVPAVRATWTRIRMLQAFQGVCQAVAFAHAQKVIHRDLTPANIMIGEFGETLVLDWGLAKDVSKKTGASTTTAFVPLGGTDDLTVMGDVLGTPAYMSPEQASGRTWDTDERTDIYSLGVILYEILTLRRAFEGTQDVILARVREGKFDPPSKAVKDNPWPRPVDTHSFDGFSKPATGPAVPRELEAVCLKAMSLKPQERQPNAMALYRDLQAWVEAGR